jgi:glycosyltransferase involved in cell wall biosynthesis
MKVVILLAAYNGARYINEQISSIRGQTFADWTLLARDDGSTDGTAELLNAAARQDSRIKVVHDQRGNLGPIGNFGALLQAANTVGADYVFLSDQDDVWLPDKVSKELGCMQAAEARYGAVTPLLVHSDLTVTDSSLNVVNKSFMTYQNIWHDDHEPIRTLLVQNFVTGCTALANRALLDLALPVPTGVLMHDWWLALCAATCGRIAYVAEPTVLYRQHRTNQVGAKGYWKSIFLAIYRSICGVRVDSLKMLVAQANLLLERVQEKRDPLDGRIASILKEYAAMLGQRGGAIRRARSAVACGVRPQTVLRTVNFYRWVILRSRESRTI